MTYALRLAQSMGMPLAELGERMSSAEFALHIELARQDAKAAMPDADKHLAGMFGG